MNQDCINPDTLKSLMVTSPDDCDFTRWLEREFSVDDVLNAIELFFVGATDDGSVVFWQVDEDFTIGSGKVMSYDPTTGKRVKDESGCGRIGWVHTLFPDAMPNGYQVKHHFFGQHQLSSRLDDEVCIVESEKTAIVCSMVRPDKIWLATAGKGMLHSLSLDALKGRNVVLYPDADGVEDWRRCLTRFADCKSVRLDEVCAHWSEAGEKYSHYDLADCILDTMHGVNIAAEVEREKQKKRDQLPKTEEEFTKWFAKFLRLTSMTHPLTFAQYTDLCQRFDPIKVAEEIAMANRCLIHRPGSRDDVQFLTVEQYLTGIDKGDQERMWKWYNIINWKPSVDVNKVRRRAMAERRMVNRSAVGIERSREQINR